MKAFYFVETAIDERDETWTIRNAFEILAYTRSASIKEYLFIIHENRPSHLHPVKYDTVSVHMDNCQVTFCSLIDPANALTHAGLMNWRRENYQAKLI